MDFEFIDIADIDSSPEEDKPEEKDMIRSRIQKKTNHNKKLSDVAGVESSLSSSISVASPKFVIPTISLTDLVFLILKSENCILTSQIWNYISGMFPYCEYTFSPLCGNSKVVSVLMKSPRLFLKHDSQGGSITKLALLNPAMEAYHKVILRKANGKRLNLVHSLYEPDLLNDLLDGTLDFKKVKMFRVKERPLKFATPEGRHGGKDDSTTCETPPQKRRKSAVAKIDEEEEQKNETGGCEQAICAESTSEDSFKPQIINCYTAEQTLAKEELNMEADTSVTSDSSSILDRTYNLGEVVEPMNFVNCVWLTNPDVEVADMESPVETPTQASFPEVEKCIVKWKEIFPWATWHPAQRTIGCAQCQFVQRNCGLTDTMAVVVVKTASEIFKVSRILRQHSDEVSHRMTNILASKQLIAVLHFMLSLHFDDFNSVSDILESCKALCDSDVNASEESVFYAFRIMGEYLEYKTVQLIKKSGNLSVTTDPCNGILIVRLLKDNASVQEHIIASYMSITHQSPMEYLVSLGIDETKVIHYVSNKRCEECLRCAKTKRCPVKSLSPMRLPNLEKFLIFLWRTSLLKPIHSLGVTIRRLWKHHPHRFLQISNLQLVKFGRFNYNPIILVTMFENMEHIKLIARQVYDKHGHVEALGVWHYDTTYFKWLLPIFPILTEIITLLVDVKCSYPLDNDQETLCQKIEALRTTCSHWCDQVPSEQYSTLVDKSDELISLISLTVKEFFEPIYFKGRSIPLAFNRVMCAEKLLKHEQSIHSNKSFEAVFSVIKPFYKYDKEALYHGLISFLKKYPTLEKMEITQLLDILRHPARNEGYQEVYEFIKLYSLLPFNSAHINRCVFEPKVYQKMFHKSAWAGLSSNVKEHILTILSQLDNKRRLSEFDMFQWWKEKYL